MLMLMLMLALTPEVTHFGANDCPSDGHFWNWSDFFCWLTWHNWLYDDKVIIILQSNLLCQSLEKYQPLVLEEIWCSLIWFGLTVNLGIVCGLPHPEACLTLSGITKRLKLRVGGIAARSKFRPQFSFKIQLSVFDKDNGKRNQIWIFYQAAINFLASLATLDQ